MPQAIVHSSEDTDWEDATVMALPSGHRLLAAIVFADMVGYTELMHQDESKAYEARTRYREAIERNVARYGGEIVQHYGDGALLLFLSAVDATRAARRLQRELRRDPQVAIRVGVHMADVVREDDGVYGTGVNLAARIQALCPPGGVLVSGVVNYEIKNKQGMESVSLGYYHIKNIDQPVEICAVADPALAVPTPGALRAPRVPREAPCAPCGDAPLRVPSRLGHRIKAFMAECRRRKVHRVAQAYAATSASGLTALEILTPMIGLPEVLWSWALAVSITGVPLVLGLSWMYDLSIRVTPETTGPRYAPLR